MPRFKCASDLIGAYLYFWSSPPQDMNLGLPNSPSCSFPLSLFPIWRSWDLDNEMLQSTRSLPWTVQIHRDTSHRSCLDRKYPQPQRNPSKNSQGLIQSSIFFQRWLSKESWTKGGRTGNYQRFACTDTSPNIPRSYYQQTLATIDVSSQKINQNDSTYYKPLAIAPNGLRCSTGLRAMADDEGCAIWSQSDFHEQRKVSKHVRPAAPFLVSFLCHLHESNIFTRSYSQVTWRKEMFQKNDYLAVPGSLQVPCCWELIWILWTLTPFSGR